jgi:TRAP transporter TAXI family solute receptor
VLGLVAALAGAGLPARAQQSLTWTSGAVGGGWYAICNGIAELMREKAGLDIKVVPGGGAQNAVLIQKGEADIGMGLPPLLQAAVNGEDPYRGQKMPDLRALAGNMSLNTVHFYVAADSPFASMTVEEIVRGRKPIRLAISRPGLSDVWAFDKIMRFYGLCTGPRVEECYRTWQTAGAKFVRGSYAEQARAFTSHNVDGTFAFLAVPADSITEASVGRPLKLLPLSEPLLEHLTEFGIGKGTIPPGAYPKAANAKETIASATMGTTVIVSVKMAEALAYTLTQTFNDNAERMRKLHASLADYAPALGYLQLGVPLHPGAERYYRERGYLK